MLHTIDTKWVDYLTQMEHFREGIGLRAYGQKDPLIEYKNEAFTMFQELTAAIQADIVANMFRVQVNQGAGPSTRPPRADRRAGTSLPGGEKVDHQRQRRRHALGSGCPAASRDPRRARQGQGRPQRPLPLRVW